MGVTPKPILPVDPDGVADEMKAAGKRWTMWHGVWNPGKGKYDKKPCDADGKLVKWRNRDNWVTFDDAIDGHLADPGTVSGVGMFMGYDEGTGLTYWLYDDDHRVDGGKIDPAAQAILDGFPYGHRELSVGRDGFHILFATEGEAPKYGHNPNGNPSELYNNGRFSTVTGIQYQDNGQPFVAPMEAVERLIALAGLKPLDGAPRADAPLVAREGDHDEHRDDDGGRERPSARDIRLAESYLSVIPSDGRETWLNVGMALHHGNYDFAIWDRWSQTSRKYDAADCRRVWDSFGKYGAGADIKFASLVDLAYRHGWLPGNPPEAGPFYLRRGVLWRAAKSKNGYAVRVTATPPYILAKITDIDPGVPDRVRVGMKVPAGYGKDRDVEFVLNRSDLFDKKVLYKTLTDLGGNLSESNAGYVVEYLTECDGAKWAANLPSERSVSHMGWAGEPLGSFMPYDEGEEGVDISFDPPFDKARISAAFQEPKGTLAEWVRIVAPLRAESTILRAMLAASFASVLLGALGVQAFVVYVWGLSGSGKSVSLKIAASVWGNPAEGAGYFAKLSDTDTAVLMRAGQLHNMPLVLDEFESIRKPTEEQKRRYFQHLAYDLSYGMERNRGNRAAKLNQGAAWNLVTISAGETPATGDTTQQGALNRIIELNGEPFEDKREAQAAHREIAGQYGTAGRAFISKMKDRDAGKMREGFDAMRDEIARALPDNPQADMLAALSFADMLAELCVFDPCGTYDEARAGAVKFAKVLALYTKGARDRDTDRRAIEYLAEWLAIEHAHFDERTYANDDRIAPYGKKTESCGSPTWYVMGGKLKEAMEGKNFNSDKALRRMRREGIVAQEQTQKRFGGSPVWCYVIDGDALDGFIESDDEGDEPADEDGP